MKIANQIIPCAGFMLFVSLSGCGSSDDVPDAKGDFVNDASDAAAATEAAYTNLSSELRDAAQEPGDLACGLPLLPDHRAGRVTDGQKNATFNTNAKPEEVAAFYRLAAETKQGEAQTGGPPGLAEVKVKLPDMRQCTIVAQAQMSGDTNVTVRFGN